MTAVIDLIHPPPATRPPIASLTRWRFPFNQLPPDPPPVLFSSREVPPDLIGVCVDSVLSPQMCPAHIWRFLPDAFRLALCFRLLSFDAQKKFSRTGGVSCVLVRFFLGLAGEPDGDGVRCLCFSRSLAHKLEPVIPYVACKPRARLPPTKGSYRRALVASGDPVRFCIGKTIDSLTPFVRISRLLSCSPFVSCRFRAQAADRQRGAAAGASGVVDSVCG